MQLFEQLSAFQETAERESLSGSAMKRLAMLEVGDLPTAERELTKALVMGGADCVAAHYHLARAYMRRGDPKEASRAIKAYLEESPKGEYVKEAKELAKKLGNDVKQSIK